MGALDEAMQAAATSVLEAVGVACTLTVLTSSYNESTGAYTETPASVPVTSSPPIRYHRKDIDGEAIREGDFKLLVAAEGLTVTPAPNKTTVAVSGLTAKVVQVGRVYSGDSVALFVLQCRE